MGEPPIIRSHCVCLPYPTICCNEEHLSRLDRRETHPLHLTHIIFVLEELYDRYFYIVNSFPRHFYNMLWSFTSTGLYIVPLHHQGGEAVYTW